MQNTSSEASQDRSVVFDGNDDSVHPPAASIPLSLHQFSANVFEDQAPATNPDYSLTPDPPLRLAGEHSSVSHNMYFLHDNFPYPLGNRDTAQTNTTPAPFFTSQHFSTTTGPSQVATNPGQSSFRMPEELIRIPSEMSVQAYYSIMEAAGRSYQSFREGRYFLPVDAVSTQTNTTIRLEMR